MLVISSKKYTDNSLSGDFLAMRRGMRRMIFILYSIAFVLLAFIIITYLYQYVAALSSLDEVVKAFFNDRILMTLWLSLKPVIFVTIYSILSLIYAPIIKLGINRALFTINILKYGYLCSICGSAFYQQML